ncbi:MAG: hypothetical protein ACR2PM_14355 [Hyphomicrobiales bacterium]
MRNLSLPMIGWVLFLMSSVAFVVSSYNSGDKVAFAGSVLFLFGCFAFLVPAGAPSRKD